MAASMTRRVLQCVVQSGRVAEHPSSFQKLAKSKPCGDFGVFALLEAACSETLESRR
jgi:hypothetical protein